jgi:Bacterial Ig-like domain/Glycosyl hydrolase family 26
MARAYRTRTASISAALIIAIGSAGTAAAPALAGIGSHHPSQRHHALATNGPTLPSTGSLFGAFVAVGDRTGSNQTKAEAAFEAMVGRKMALDKEGYAWDEDWPDSFDNASRDQGRTLVFEWNASLFGGGVISWSDIADGLHDAEIDARAQDLKAFGAPAFFVFHHEPEDEVGEAGTTQDFIDAYQHVHDRFVADGVTNVSYVLQLLAFTYAQGEADQYYPGDGYVDLLAADGYNWYSCPGRTDPWKTFAEVFQGFHDYGVAKGKPLFVQEFGSMEDPDDPGHKGQWITDAAATIKGWPQIKAVAYYHNGSPGANCDWWVDTSQASLDAFQAMGADSYFNPPPPLVTITSGPEDPSNSTSATFTFSANVPGSTFTCTLDGGTPKGCSSPYTLSGLSQGAHTETITATDPISGQSGSTLWTWSVDSIAPVLTILSGPSGDTSNTTATFNLDSNEPVPPGWFTCQLDSQAPTDCGSWVTYDDLADGPHTFTGIANDEAGNASPPGVRTWTVDTVPPTATITSGPASPSNSKSATFTFTSSESGSTFKCAKDQGASIGCTSPNTYNGLSDGDHTLSVTAIDPAGNPSAPATWAWTIDATKPAITITSSPSQFTQSTSASFSFTVDDASPVTSTCQLDSAPPAPCGAGAQGGSASDSFSRSSQDSWGPANLGGTWTVVGGNPEFDVNGVAGTINLAVSESGRTAYLPLVWGDQDELVRFMVDKMPTSKRVNAYAMGRYDAASGSFYGVRVGLVPDGTIRLDATKKPVVGAETALGTEVNLGSGGAANTWYWIRAHFETQGSNVLIEGKTWKDGTSEPTSWQFTYLDTSSALVGSGRPGVRAVPWATDLPVVVSFDDFSAQTGLVYLGLAPGVHTETITTTDEAGNVGTEVYTWTVDVTPPILTITSGPPANYNQKSATIKFTSSEPGSTFTCAIDGGPSSSCTSPTTYTGLSDGSHTVTVTATDKAGNVSAPATWTWSVDTVMPITTITSGPNNPSNSKSGTFNFTSNESGSTFKCKLDAGSFVNCTSPKTFFGLSDGTHTVSVEAVDKAGNVGLPVSYTWTVDATKPTVTITSGPPNPSPSSTATFTFSSSEQGVTFTCQLDSGAPATCVSGVTYTGVSVGNHTFIVFATDQAGNVSRNATWKWTKI